MILHRAVIGALLLSFPLAVQCFVSPTRQAYHASLLYSSTRSEEDEEWHPRDPAHTTPQLLAALWHQIAEAGNLVRGVSVYNLSDLRCLFSSYCNRV